jgi:hypothetical protein
LSRRTLAAVALLTVAGALTRLAALRALPIFGDEAIFLRLARLVRADPSRNLWLPLNAPSAPLHPWLLALSLPFCRDPVTAGRLLSVVSGALLIPAFAWAVRRMDALFSGESETRAAVVAATALTLTSPFLIFSARLARVDVLFAAEVALVTGLALELVIRARRGGRLIAPAIALGAVLGLTMLTRQAVSYVLWLLPPFAALLAGPGNRRRLALATGLALILALALWAPMLVAPAWPDLSARIFHIAASRPSLPAGERIALFGRNLGIAAAAFWTYLTPPVVLAAIAGAGELVRTRRTRLLAFLAAWEVLLLVPAALFATDYFPRYALPASLPLLAVAAFGVASLGARIRGAGPVFLAALALWGAVDVFRGERDWKRWRLLPIDRRQFVSGWSAGAASERAAAFLEARSREGRISVVVPQVSGNPSDAVWLLLEDAKSVRLFYAEDFLRLPALRVKGDVWKNAPATEVDPDRPVYFVSPDPVFLGREGWTPAARVVPPRNPGARLVARFENPADERGRVESAVEVFRLE